MNNIDVRAYIMNNFKNNSIEEIKNSIEESISLKEEDPLIGLGVLFEVMWNNSTLMERDNILKSIKKGITN